MSEKNEESNKYFIVSLLIHSGLAFAAANVPPVDMFPEGNADFIEFEMEAVAPKGQQLNTQDVGEIEDPTPVEPEVTIPKPAPKVKPKVEVVKEEPKPLVLPEKVEEVKKLDMKPVETLTAEQETEEPIPVVAVPEKEEVPDAPEVENTPDEELEKEIAAAEVAAAESPADDTGESTSTEEATEVADKEPVVAPSTLVNGEKKIAKGLRHQSNMNYGVPTGVRDYRDLRQYPGNVPPQYPENSRRRGEQGTVKLMYFVTSEGRVSGVRLTQSSGHSRLDNEALRAISRYRYRPGQQGYTSHSINFKLRGEAKAGGGRLRTSSNIDNYNSDSL